MRPSSGWLCTRHLANGVHQAEWFEGKWPLVLPQLHAALDRYEGVAFYAGNPPSVMLQNYPAPLSDMEAYRDMIIRKSSR